MYTLAAFCVAVSNGCGTNNGGCNQLCLPKGETDKVCKCTAGYELDREQNCVGELMPDGGPGLGDTSGCGFVLIEDTAVLRYWHL